MVKKLYEYQPDIARPLLTENWWEQVQHASPKKAQGLCEDILKYDPNHLNARKKLCELWKERGNRAYKEKEWENARRAYRQAFNIYSLKTLQQELTKVNKAIFLHRHLERLLYVGGFLLSLGISYVFIPKTVLLEIDQRVVENTQVYSLISLPFEEPLESLSVKFNSPYPSPVEKAYQGTEKSPLVNTSVHPNYQYILTQKDKLKFVNITLQIPSREMKEILFTCQTQTTQQISLPCKVIPKGYSPLWRGIPWWIWGSLSGIFLIMIIKVFFLLIHRKPRHVF